MKKKQQEEAAKAASAAGTPDTSVPGTPVANSASASTSSLTSLRSISGSGTPGSTGSRRGQQYGTLRLQKDIGDLDLPSTMRVYFPEGDRDLMNFDVYITPDEGMYSGGTFKFKFNVTSNFPHEPPKVICAQTIYHPNIDLQGHVCLNILRNDWKPVLTIESVLIGLQFLFLEPNPTDPLNKDAANQYVKNREEFKRKVRNTMSGDYLEGVSYDDVRTLHVELPQTSGVESIGNYK